MVQKSFANRFTNVYNCLMNDECKNCRLCCKIIPAKNGIIIRDGFIEACGDFTEISLEDAIKVNKDYVKKIQDNLGKTKFYKCKFISDDNKCTSPALPDYCKNFPSCGISIVPDECTFAGNVFLLHEEIKQKVRKTKEEILYYETMIISDKKNKKAYEKIIRTLEKFNNKYKPLGADMW